MTAAWMLVIIAGGLVAAIFAAFVAADIAAKHRRVS